MHFGTLSGSIKFVYGIMKSSLVLCKVKCIPPFDRSLIYVGVTLNRSLIYYDRVAGDCLFTLVSLC